MIRILLSALALGAATDLFLVQASGPGLNCFLFTVVFLVAVLVATGRHEEVIIRKDLLFLGALSLLGSSTFFLFDSVYAEQLATLGVAFLLGLFFLTSAGLSFLLPFEQYFEALLHFLETLPKSLGALRRSLRSHSSHNLRALYKGGFQLLIGLLILIPVAAVFLALFSSADPVFQDSLNSFFESLFDSEYLSRLLGHLFFIPLFFFLWLMPLGVVRYLNEHKHETGWDMRSFDEQAWSYIVIGGLIVLFGLFLGVQGFYLFGGEAAFGQIDLTYAEYAKQGFYELMAVAGLVLGLISVYHALMKTQRVAGRTLFSLLLIETFVVLLSAFVRLSLYVDTYGLTAARHAGYWVLIMTLVSLGGALFLNWVPKYSRLTPALVAVLFAIGTVIYPFSTPDRVIAKYNIERDQEFYFSEVSDFGHSIGADGLLYLLPYYNETLPKDLGVVFPEYPQDAARVVCSLERERYVTRAHDQEIYAYQVGRAYERLSRYEYDKFFEWNLARHRLIASDAETPLWLRVLSSDYYDEHCSSEVSPQ